MVNLRKSTSAGLSGLVFFLTPHLKRLIVAVVLSVALHGVLMFVFRTPGHGVSVMAPQLAFSVVIDPNRRTALQSEVDPAPLTSERPKISAGGVQPSNVGVQPLNDAHALPQKDQAAKDRAPGTNELPPAPAYQSGAGLDPPPRPLGNIEPEYPHPEMSQSGRVTLRLLISETGALDDVRVMQATPPGMFEQAAINAFRDAKFSPGMFHGVAVKSQMIVELEFTPLNRGSVSGRGY